MRRRDVIAGAGSLATSATVGFPAPSIAQEIRQLKMVTDWPAGLPGLQGSADRFAKAVGDASGGRIKIDVYPAGTFVSAFETFDAVADGVADLYHTYEGYFEKKSQAFHFFAALPFGLTPSELNAWVRYGGGQELWDELSGQFNIKSFLACTTGPQTGGWFAREVMSPESFKGLRYRMTGPGAEVLRRMGATVVVVPGGQIVQSLKSGAIDGSEFAGPWLDTWLGLHNAVGVYFYYPGWHEPGTGIAIGVNKRVWDALPTSDQRLFEAAVAAEYSLSLAESDMNNALSLRKLRQDGAVKIRKFDDATLKALFAVSRNVVAEIGSGDELSRKIYTSYEQYRAAIVDWSDISVHAYLNGRILG
jgi:TRAP-type mannitol/chloroaromatic compound transport system substrate-binding protein